MGPQQRNVDTTLGRPRQGKQNLRRTTSMLFTDASLPGHIASGRRHGRRNASRRRRDRRLRTFWRHEQYPRRWRLRPQRIIQRFDIQLGRSDLITSVGHGPTGIDTAPPPVSANVTRALPDACATPSRRTKKTLNNGTCRPKAGRQGLGPWRTSTRVAMSSLAKNVAAPMVTDKGLDCPVWDVAKNVW